MGNPSLSVIDKKGLLHTAALERHVSLNCITRQFTKIALVGQEADLRSSPARCP